MVIDVWYENDIYLMIIDIEISTYEYCDLFQFK